VYEDDEDEEINRMKKMKKRKERSWVLMEVEDNMIKNEKIYSTARP
jgi:hypothetical protein